MIARLTVSLLLLTAIAAFAPAASANPFAFGDCDKAGACVGGCVALTTACGDGDLACVGASYQVPQCVSAPAELGPLPSQRCASPVCDAINLACYAAFKQPCVR